MSAAVLLMGQQSTPALAQEVAATTTPETPVDTSTPPSGRMYGAIDPTRMIRFTAGPTYEAIATQTAEATLLPPSATSAPSATPLPPSATSVPPTATERPAPSATPQPTNKPPTATQPAPTSTKPAPTATQPVPTSTKPAPTATQLAPTPTTAPSSTAAPSATDAPSATPVATSAPTATTPVATPAASATQMPPATSVPSATTGPQPTQAPSATPQPQQPPNNQPQQPAEVPTAEPTQAPALPTGTAKPTLQPTARRTALPTSTPALVIVADERVAAVVASPTAEPKSQSSGPSISPAGLVYTIAARRVSNDKIVVAACVANIGKDAVREVEVTFALHQAGATLTTLRAPLMPGEVSQTQARAIANDVPARQQFQISVVVQSQVPLSDGSVQVDVPKAYRLTSADPALVCDPADLNEQNAAWDEAHFEFGGEPIKLEQATQALQESGAFGSLGQTSNGPQFRTNTPGLVSVPADWLLFALPGLLVMAGVLAVFAFARRR